jgi:BirA family biotin operon repressor/biotin-[acetyl-CoA-carboxylase] ligase
MASILHIDEVESTQDVAKEQARAGAAHGTMVWADRQSAGRGRRGRSWQNAEHALLCSIVLRPMVPMRLASRLPLCVCAAVLEVIDPQGQALWAKWPNDVLIAAKTDAPRIGPFRKVGGVLVEAIDSTVALDVAVVGIGINVSGAVAGELAGYAGTLADAGLVWQVEPLVHALARGLPALPQRMTDAAFVAVRQRLSQRSATLGRRVDIDGVVGTAGGIDDDGALVVERDDGTRTTVRSGDAWLHSEHRRQ